MDQCEGEVSNDGVVPNASKPEHVTDQGADDGISHEVSTKPTSEHAMDQCEDGDSNDGVVPNASKPEHVTDQGADDGISHEVSTKPTSEHAMDQCEDGDSNDGVVPNASKPEHVTDQKNADDGISHEVSIKPTSEHAMDQREDGDSNNGVSNGSEPKDVTHQRADDVSSYGFAKHDSKISKPQPKNELAPKPNRVPKMEIKQENSMGAQVKAELGCNVKCKNEAVQGRVKQKQEIGNPGQDEPLEIHPGYYNSVLCLMLLIFVYFLDVFVCFVVSECSWPSVFCWSVWMGVDGVSLRIS